MISRKKQLNIAKTLFKKSLNSNGFIDSQKARKLINFLLAAKPVSLTNILKAYKRLVEAALAREEVIVESATRVLNLKDLERRLLKKTAARKIIYKTNPHIILGAKITNGDWVWEETLDSKLEQLTKN